MSSFVLNQQTFSENVETFLFDRESKGRAKKTISFYQSELNLFGRWLGDKEVSSDTLRRYFVDLSSTRNTGGRHCSYRVLKAFLNFVEEEEVIPDFKNPIRKVKISSSKNPPLPEYTLDEVQKLLSVCTNPRDIFILKEFLSLNYGDIDFSTGSVLIKHGKGDKARIVWLGKSARKALLDYLSTREELIPTSPLILNEDGVRLKFFGLREVVKRLCKRANVPHKGLHSFRRCFALSLYRKGIDILSISRLLGHTSIEVTKRYLNINNEDLKKVMDLASPADSLE